MPSSSALTESRRRLLLEAACITASHSELGDTDRDLNLAASSRWLRRSCTTRTEWTGLGRSSASDGDGDGGAAAVRGEGGSCGGSGHGVMASMSSSTDRAFLDLGMFLLLFVFLASFFPPLPDVVTAQLVFKDEKTDEASFGSYWLLSGCRYQAMKSTTIYWVGILGSNKESLCCWWMCPFKFPNHQKVGLKLGEREQRDLFITLFMHRERVCNPSILDRADEAGY